MYMMNLKNILFLFSVLIQSIAYPQLATEYFNELKADKVISNDSLNWVQLGPGMSGYCEFFWCHPTDPTTMHMAPDMFNGYGSWDSGKSWQSIKDYDGRGFDMG